MAWNTEPLLTERGPRAQPFDEARDNVSAARDQFFLHLQRRSFFTTHTVPGQRQTLWAFSRALHLTGLVGGKEEKSYKVCSQRQEKEEMQGL